MRFVWSSVVAVAGIVLLFVHELHEHAASAGQIVAGILLTLGGMIGAATANVVQARPEIRRYTLFALLAWSMAMGALIDGLLAWVLAGPPTFDPRPSYWLGVLYLALAASVLTFSLYYPVVRRIGPAKAAYSSVIVPIIAMAFSTWLEDYRWTPTTIAGAVLALGGMAAALSRSRSSVPTPDAAWIDTWHGVVQQYGLTPTNFGSWVDTTRFYGRDLTAEEGAEQLQLDLRLAKELGFTSVRPKFGVTSWDLDTHPIWQETIERSLDLAAELDVVICPEIHTPTPIKHPVTQGYIDFIEKTGTEHFKLLIDTGIFNTEPITDTSEEIDGDGEEIPPHLRPLKVPMADFVDVLPYTHFIQAKFVEIDDDLHDLHVPWAQVIPTLLDNGWSGYLSSEYEGRREPGRGRDQVRRQHALLRSLQSGA